MSDSIYKDPRMVKIMADLSQEEQKDVYHPLREILQGGGNSGTAVRGGFVLTTREIELAAIAIKARPILCGVAFHPEAFDNFGGACTLIHQTGDVFVPRIPAIIDPRLSIGSAQPFFEKEAWEERVKEQNEWDAKMAMPTMYLDSSLPKTSMAPIHPQTGEVWAERQMELVIAATDARYESDPLLRSEAAARLKALKDGIEFREEPHFVENITSDPPRWYPKTRFLACHPDTWDALPEDQKKRFLLLKDESRQQGMRIKLKP